MMPSWPTNANDDHQSEQGTYNFQLPIMVPRCLLQQLQIVFIIFSAYPNCTESTDAKNEHVATIHSRSEELQATDDQERTKAINCESTGYVTMTYVTR